MQAIAALPAAALIAGAALGLHVGLPFAAACVLLVSSVAGAAAGWMRGRAPLVAVCVALGFFSGGWLMATAESRDASRPPLREQFERRVVAERHTAAAQGRRLPEDAVAMMVVEGVLRADAAPSASGVSLSVAVDRIHVEREASAERTRGGTIVTVVGALAADRLDTWRAGRRVRFPAMLHRPARYLDPGVPDFERALARRGTTLVGSVKSGALVEIVARGSRLDEALGSGRAFARRAIGDAVGPWSAQSAAIVRAIVIGDRVGLDDRLQRRLQEAGTYHVIAISGGNIAILAGVLLGAFRLAGWLGRTAMLSAIVLLMLYARLVGDSASVDRATLMAVVYLGARAADQRSPPINALAVVAALLVAADTLTVADPAFMLTAGATLAILLAVPLVVRDGAPRAVNIVATTFVASVAAEALLFPIGAVLFSRVTFAGLLLNFVAIPLMAVAQIAGMLLVPIALASRTASALVGWIAHLGAAGLVASADLVQLMPIVSYRLAPPSALAVALYYGASAVSWTLWRHRVTHSGSGERPWLARIRRGTLVVSIAAALWILTDPHTLVARRGDGRLHLTFIDVGQGDATFIVFPRGSTMLVDAGGLAGSSFDVGDRVVAPVIRDAGFSRLGVVALTHGDPDHMGGAAAVVEEFRPREVWEGISVPRHAGLAALRQQTESLGSRWASVHAGDRRVIDEVEVVVRHPDRADWERQKVRNDDSIVLELRWRDVSVLLTGDIGRVPERAIVPAIPGAPLRIVKVPHHGSLTSSTDAFIEAIKPTIAIASAGRSNTFGHPVPEVLERYRAAGAEVFRTDRDGAVTVTSDGRSIAVETVAHPGIRVFPPPGSHENTKTENTKKKSNVQTQIALP